MVTFSSTARLSPNTDSLLKSASTSSVNKVVRTPVSMKKWARRQSSFRFTIGFLLAAGRRHPQVCKRLFVGQRGCSRRPRCASSGGRSRCNKPIAGHNEREYNRNVASLATRSPFNGALATDRRTRATRTLALVYSRRPARERNRTHSARRFSADCSNDRRRLAKNGESGRHPFALH